ncbi:pyridoxal phosphate-dependent aminotransferase [Paludibaculum fermentans]|uniref:Aminotransferase n=1 Tax=Paludibaculum fermentans TaxID=1473598 RepID=A0A7S7NW41_PALFE|nr:pyridoxal phosphate-dependent aminotransferase [Paludibaculum fermentans]QOY90859.1 pyridoxal phosphate-dependent aminotransferase [Paludibaculum fermentans]
MQQASSHLADRISLISVSSTARVSAEAEKLRRAGVDVVDFGVGEPDFPTPDNIKRAAIAALDQNFTRYTAMPGVQELRQAVVDRHKADYGTSYSVPECVVSVGGKHAIFNMTQALVGDGDEVIIPIPYWVTYYDVVNYAGGKPVLVETSEAEGFALTAAQVEKAITPKTRLMIVNSPCNPSGALVEQAEFEKIAHLAKKRGIWLMTDECYCRFLYDSDPYSVASVPGMKDTVIVAGSLSKTYAMTGWRIGFTLAPAEVCTAIIKLQSHSTSNPTSIAQKGAIEALNGPQDSVDVMLAEYRKRRDYVIGRLRAIPGITCAEPRGAFYAYPNISGALSPNGLRTPMEFAEKLLAEAHVAAVPGEAFGTEKHVRISYATSMENIQKGLDRLESFVKKYSA